MGELTFKSPGVSTREIDLSGPTSLSPRGIPAGIVGTSVRGPAFVPITFATFQDFVATFGNTDGEKFGPLAVHEWMRNAGAGTYVRVLGIGNAKAKNSGGSNPGNVTNAGFVVGNQVPKSNGLLGGNVYATGGGPLGRTYFLSCFMSESAGSTLFSDTGIQISGENIARPILRGVVMAPSGVVLSLSCSLAAVSNNSPDQTSADGYFGSSADAGAAIGDVITGSAKQEFVMLLNGQKVSDDWGNVITASFDPKSPSYFSNVFNTDPTLIQPAGHYLYAHYDVDPQFAEITGSGLGMAPRDVLGGGNKASLALLFSGSAGRNTGAAADSSNVGTPNFENFEDRFSAAFSPSVVSQKFGGSNVNLFKLYALDDGAAASQTFKITIENVQASSNPKYDYGTFDLLVRRFDDSDMAPTVLESFRGLSLNPSSERYIARAVGDTSTFFDFDKKAGGQKLVIEGKYPNNSQFIRVATTTDLDAGRVNATALPTGFRGLYHLVTSGTATDGTNTVNILTGTQPTPSNEITSSVAGQIVQPPVPLREDIAVGISPKKNVEPSLTWGVQFELKDDLNQVNKNQKLDESLRSLVKLYPTYHTSLQNPWVGANEGTPDKGGCVLDADSFNNNFFSLEKVEVITNSSDKPDPQQWSVAKYRRTGRQAGSMTDRDGNTGNTSRLLDPTKDFDHLPTRKYLKFTFPLMGGFNGLNIFDKDKSKLTDNAARREMADATNQGGVAGPTVAAYRKAIDVMESKSDVDIQLLAIPGIRHESVTDYAIESTERRFDALLIMDVEEKDTVDAYVTSSADQNINVSNTVSRFSGRALDSSFAAAYFPDVVVTDPSTETNVQCPPSVAVLGAFSLNDVVAHPWFAPAGFTRGALSSVVESQVKFNRNNLDELYTADINPLTSFPHTPGVVVFGQKTLLAAQSALDRVNVRRLLIDVRRKVKRVANTLLFEPNRTETLARFSSAVTPILTQIQQQQGLDRFKVQIDTSTTTQADVENNTIRGKIFLQPTRSVEFISLDFVVTNAGADV